MLIVRRTSRECSLLLAPKACVCFPHNTKDDEGATSGGRKQCNLHTICKWWLLHLHRALVFFLVFFFSTMGTYLPHPGHPHVEW